MIQINNVIDVLTLNIENVHVYRQKHWKRKDIQKIANHKQYNAIYQQPFKTFCNLKALNLDFDKSFQPLSKLNILHSYFNATKTVKMTVFIEFVRFHIHFLVHYIRIKITPFLRYKWSSVSKEKWLYYANKNLIFQLSKLTKSHKK